MKYSVLLASAVVALSLSACNKPAASAETGYPAPQGDIGGHGSTGNMTPPDDGGSTSTGTQSAPGNPVPQTDDGSSSGMSNPSGAGSSGPGVDNSMQNGTSIQTNPGTPAGPGSNSGSGTTIPPSPIE
jgi:hypothetical protein